MRCWTRDTSFAQACVLAALAMSPPMLRDAVNSDQWLPVTALLPGLVLVATRSSALARAILTIAVVAGRIWLLTGQPLWHISTVTHCVTVAALFLVSHGIRGPASFAFLLLNTSWTPLWWDTERGHFHETAAALGVLGVYLARTRWKLDTGELRWLAGALFVTLMAFGGSVHIPLMVVTLSAFWIIAAPLEGVE